MAAPGVTPLPDTPIDRFERVYCDGQYFGEPITLEQVYEAGRIENLPEGADYVTYQAVYPNSPNYIPKQFFSGKGCGYVGLLDRHCSLSNQNLVPLQMITRLSLPWRWWALQMNIFR